MSLGSCGLYVTFRKKKGQVGHDQQSSPQENDSDHFDSFFHHPNSSRCFSKSQTDGKPLGLHTRSVSQGGNIHKPSRNVSISSNCIPKTTFNCHQRSVSQADCYETRRNHIALNRSRDASQVVLSSACPNYGHGNIIKGLNGRLHNPASVQEINKLANMKYRNGCFEEAIAFYDKVIALCPEDASVHTNKAAALIKIGRLTEAVEGCLKAIKCDPSCSPAHFRLGTLFTRFGQVDDARWHFMLSQKCIDSETTQRLKRIEGHYVSTNKAREVKDWDVVLRESTLCIEAGADASNQLVALKAEALFKLQRVDEGYELVSAASHSEENRVTKPRKGISCLLIIETKLNLHLGRFEKGVKSAEKAVEMDSTRKSVKWLKRAKGAADARKCGNDLYRDKKYMEACTMFSQALQHVPKNSVLLCDRAACRSKLKQWQMAIQDCNAALRERPNFHKALLWRAHSYARLRRWKESMNDYSALSREFPDDEFIASSLDQVKKELRRARTSRFSSLEPILETYIY